MEKVSCIVCGSKTNKHFLDLTDRFSGEFFSVVSCKCGFKYLSPRPTFSEISKYYENENYDPHKENELNKFDKLYKLIQKLTIKWKYKYIIKFIKRGSLLDIGGGSGEFCNYLKKKKWDVSLQDFSKKARALSIQRNVKAYSSIDEIENKKFDLITMWHSLEHIHDIESLFIDIDRVTHRGSCMVIAIPNFNAPEKKFFSKKWAPYDVPRHLYHFRYRDVKKLLNHYGWYINDSKSLFQDTPYNILLSLHEKKFLTYFKAISILIFSLCKTLIFGVKYSSSFMVLCRKK